MKNYIGIDNGVSGSIGIINEQGSYFFETPVKKEQNYTKKKGNISRIDINELTHLMYAYIEGGDVMVMIERPMVNPQRFKATTSALRALEATLIFLELNGYPFEYIDSKEWQKALLPKGAKGSVLKTTSVDIGKRLFPQHTELIEKHKDADGLLMAEYCRRKYGHSR